MELRSQLAMKRHPCLKQYETSMDNESILFYFAVSGFIHFWQQNITTSTPLKTNMSPESQWLVQMYSLLK